MSPQKKPPGDEPSLRILPPIDEDESSNRDPDVDLGEGERKRPDSDGQQFYRKLYTAVVYVALSVVVASVGMLLMGHDIPGEVMAFLGGLIAYLLFPLLYRIITDTPWSEIPLENRKTLKVIVTVLLSVLGLIGLLAMRSVVLLLL